MKRMKGMRSLLKSIFVIIFFCVVYQSQSQVYDAVIAQDGTGDYTSIERALSRIRSNQSGRYLFYIKPGVYEEKVKVSLDKVSLIGEGVNEVIVSWNDYSGDSQNHSTSSSYTFEAEGDDFYAENITFRNTAGNVGQAVAVSATGTNQIFKNCRMIGFQDTYYTRKGKQYNVDCYIEGATDFIFGEATSVFDNCEIKCLSGGQYITAPADTKLITTPNGSNFYHGLLFLNSQILPGDGVGANSYYLGRPWQPNSSSVYVNCTLGNHIKPAGWSEWSDNNHLTAHFSEYRSVQENGNLVDVSNRVSWSSQLSADDVTNYYNLNYFFNGWDPEALVDLPPTPGNVRENGANTTNFELNWDEVSDVLGYVLMKNDSLIAFLTETFFLDVNFEKGDVYKVRSVNSYGVMSEASQEVIGQFTITGNEDLSKKMGFIFMKKEIKLNAASHISVYTIAGSQVVKDQYTERLSLHGLRAGVYLIRIQSKEGKVFVKKVAI